MAEVILLNVDFYLKYLRARVKNKMIDAPVDVVGHCGRMDGA